MNNNESNGRGRGGDRGGRGRGRGRGGRGGGRGGDGRGGRGRGRASDRTSDNFLLNNTEHLRQYNELLKDARTWNSQGEYWLGKDAEIRAECLLKGDVQGSKKVSGQELGRLTLEMSPYNS